MTLQKLTPLILLILGLTLVLAGGYYLNENTALPVDLSAAPVRVNYPAPKLTLTDTTGVTRSLRDSLGQVTLINLWATWCEPCKEEIPILQAYYEAHKDEGFTILAINDGESAEQVNDFLASYNVTFTVLLDPDSLAMTGDFKSMGLPTTFVMDRKGNIRMYWLGIMSAEKLEETLAPLLSE